MKNREKFAEQILDLACKWVHFGVDKRTGNVISCHSQNGCNNCKAVTCQTDTLKDWLESSYKGE